MESYRCGGCGEDLVHLGDGPPPERCEDCIPETGPGSPLLDRLTVNLRRLRADAGIDRGELATRAGMTAREISQSEGDAAWEPSVTKALRLARSLGASIDDLVERIYWNPGEVASRPSQRRPPSERLAGFFQVLPPNVPIFEPAVLHVIADRHEAAAIFGQSVRDARERRHLTQATLAQATGLSKAGLSLIERGLSGRPSTGCWRWRAAWKSRRTSCSGASHGNRGERLALARGEEAHGDTPRAASMAPFAALVSGQDREGDRCRCGGLVRVGLSDRPSPA